MTENKNTNRTEIKDLQVEEKEMTSQEMENVQGGRMVRDMAIASTADPALLPSTGDSSKKGAPLPPVKSK